MKNGWEKLLKVWIFFCKLGFFFLIALYPTDHLAAFWQVHNAIFTFLLSFEMNSKSPWLQKQCVDSSS